MSNQDRQTAVGSKKIKEWSTTARPPSFGVGQYYLKYHDVIQNMWLKISYSKQTFLNPIQIQHENSTFGTVMVLRY